jgi:disulfide bond formation protein DsbB
METAYIIGVCVCGAIWFVALMLTLFEWQDAYTVDKPSAARWALGSMASALAVPIWFIVVPIALLVGIFLLFRALIRDARQS